jgi:hypothetical protein
MARFFASLWLTLLLSLSLMTGAVAQGMAAGAPDRGPLQAVVICADGHEAVVLIDLDGQPVEKDAPCPEFGCADCPRLPAALTSPDAAATARSSVRKRLAATARAQLLIAIHVSLPSARGPPEKV